MSGLLDVVLGFSVNLNKKNEGPISKKLEGLPELTEAEFKAIISDINAKITSETCKGGLTTGIEYGYTSKDCPGGILISTIIHGKTIKFCAKCHNIIGYKVKGKPPP